MAVVVEMHTIKDLENDTKPSHTPGSAVVPTDIVLKDADLSSEHSTDGSESESGGAKGGLFGFKLPPPNQVCLLGPFVDFVGLGAILPLLPFWTEENGAPEIWVGLILSAQYGAVVLGSSCWGYVSDRFGPRRVMISLLLLDVLLFFASGICTTPESLLAVRFLAGFCTPLSVSTAWITSTTAGDKMQLAMSHLNVSILSGFIIGTLFGSVVGSLAGWFATTTATSVVALLSAALVWRLTEPLATDPSQEGMMLPKPEGLANTYTKPLFLATAFDMFKFGQEAGVGMAVFGLVLRDVYGYSETLVGIGFSALAATLLLSSIILNDWLHITDRFGMIPSSFFFGIPDAAVHAALTVMFIVAPTGFQGGQYLYIALWMFVFVGHIVLSPCSFTNGSVCASAYSKNAEGSIMGTLNSALSLGQAVGPTVGTALYSMSPWYPCAYLAIFALISTASQSYIYFGVFKKGKAPA